ncbi:hypothetical protein G6F35_013357 [Rhizopus arrhizus]|nr:hypothetical protein G6F35_013357 [Rhizopus arrhizus]
MGDAGKDLVKTMGVSGVNIMQDGKEVRAHNPHTTLVYSMAINDTRLQDAMKQESDKFNAVLPDGINTTFKDVSIVEIGFAGNVVREIYRVSLEDGSVIDVATGKKHLTDLVAQPRLLRRRVLAARPHHHEFDLAQTRGQFQHRQRKVPAVRLRHAGGHGGGVVRIQQHVGRDAEPRQVGRELQARGIRLQGTVEVGRPASAPCGPPTDAAKTRRRRDGRAAGCRGENAPALCRTGRWQCPAARRPGRRARNRRARTGSAA